MVVALLTAAALAVAALAVVVWLVPPGAEAKRSRLRCSDGVTLFAEGRLRIFGVHYHTSSETGYTEYACTARRRRPLSVGGVGHDTGVGSGATLAYALGGSRYLGTFDISDGEGGGSGSFEVVDLNTRRTVVFANASYSDRAPPFRVAADGTLITDAEEVHVQRPGSRHVTTLSTPSVLATDLAMVGNLAYWTEHPAGVAPVARSATLAGVPGGPEAHMLAPVRPRAKGGACRAARGRTIAGSGSVRVYERTTSSGAVRRLACRIGGSKPVRIGTHAAPAPRIVADRWLLSLGGSGAAVVDMRTGKTVTTVQGDIRQATLLDSGSLAWLEAGGRLLAQRPADDAPVELAPATASPGALASSRHTLYWTAGGAPQATAALR
jgi:hypothetical protein